MSKEIPQGNIDGIKRCCKRNKPFWICIAITSLIIITTVNYALNPETLPSGSQVVILIFGMIAPLAIMLGTSIGAIILFKGYCEDLKLKEESILSLVFGSTAIIIFTLLIILFVQNIEWIACAIMNKDHGVCF